MLREVKPGCFPQPGLSESNLIHYETDSSRQADIESTGTGVFEFLNPILKIVLGRRVLQQRRD